jgi:hypothetical protein
MPDEPYSRNLATSDLYLFSTVKEKFEQIHQGLEDCASKPKMSIRSS